MFATGAAQTYTYTSESVSELSLSKLTCTLALFNVCVLKCKLFCSQGTVACDAAILNRMSLVTSETPRHSKCSVLLGCSFQNSLAAIGLAGFKHASGECSGGRPLFGWLQALRWRPFCLSILAEHTHSLSLSVSVSTGVWCGSGVWRGFRNRPRTLKTAEGRRKTRKRALLYSAPSSDMHQRSDSLLFLFSLSRIHNFRQILWPRGLQCLGGGRELGSVESRCSNEESRSPSLAVLF